MGVCVHIYLSKPWELQVFIQASRVYGPFFTTENKNKEINTFGQGDGSVGMYLICKHEDMSWIPSTQAGCAESICNAHTGHQRQGNPWVC